MKNNLLRIVSIVLLTALLIAITPHPVYAAAVVSVSPSTITNDVAKIITVTGDGFDSTSKILLDGTELPGTVYVDANTLRATIQSGLSVGDHIVTVSTASGLAVLHVTAPASPPPFSRPQFVVRTSKVSGGVRTGGNITLKVVIENVGQSTAYGAQAVFASADLVPTKTGGVVVIGNVNFDDEVGVDQTFYVSAQISGPGILVTDMTVTYYDEKGTTYSDKFTLSIPVNGGNVSSGGGGSVSATATPTGVKSSQLVITGYSSNVDPLQPGVQFALALTVENVGNASAQRITMIVGGGSSGSGGMTPQPGGVSGGAGDFTNFAPVGASNVQSLGDLKTGAKVKVTQNLIVNVSTNPGAYPMKITFSYLNDKNEVINDEQVITLLVYSLPNVDVSFYRPPDPFSAGQPGALPIQVVNLGKRPSVLGNIKIESEGGMIENGNSLVGSLDPGGYFTLDSMLTPDQPGTVKLNITIDYLDDFNQPRTITRSIDVEVMEAPADPSLDPSFNGGGGGGGGEVVVQEETTLHKVFRFIKGLFGLDSAWPVWQAPGGGGQQFEQTVPVQPIPGKG